MNDRLRRLARPIDPPPAPPPPPPPRDIADALAAALAHEGIAVHRLTEPAVSGKVYAWTCPECGTFVSTFVRLADLPSADGHADCGTECACYERGVDDQWEATRL